MGDAAAISNHGARATVAQRQLREPLKSQKVLEKIEKNGHN
jgi:hypothetical protein